jgi:hypothetical protein
MTQFLWCTSLSSHYCTSLQPHLVCTNRFVKVITLNISVNKTTWQLERNKRTYARKGSITAQGRYGCGLSMGLLWHSLQHICATFCSKHTNRETHTTQKGTQHTTVFIPTYWKFTPVWKTFIWWTDLEFVQGTNKSTIFQFSASH